MVRAETQSRLRGYRILAVAILVSATLHLLVLLAAVLRAPSPSPSREPSRAAVKPALSKALLAEAKPLVSAPKPKPKPKQPMMMFVETSDDQPTGALPEDVKFYGKQTTVAANPEVDPSKLGENPLIKGTQDKVPSTTDVPLVSSSPTVPPLSATPAPPRAPQPEAKRQPTQPAQPSPPPQPEPAKTTEPSPEKTQLVIEPSSPTNPKTSPTPSEKLTPPTDKPQQMASLVTPQPSAEPSRAVPTPSLPTSRNIPARQSKMTESSVPRRGSVSLNVQGTPFGVYDEKLVAAVSRRWHLLLSDQFWGDRSGVVEIHFVLKEDGTVPDLRIESENVGAVLAGYCQAAIVGSTPFDPFPEEMRALLGADRRELDFTFYY
jgi:hypothetical protein